MSSLSTPAAIVIGLGLVGVFAGTGLYFGLRARPATPGAPALAEHTAAGSISAPATATMAAPPIAPSPVPIGAGTAAEPAAQSAAVAEVTRAFEAKRAQLLHDCWAPSVARAPDPPQIVITFMLGYGPDGHILSRGLREDRNKVRPDVTACVKRELEVPDITPLGAPTRVTLALTLP